MPFYYVMAKSAFYGEAGVYEAKNPKDAARQYREDYDPDAGDTILVFAEKDAKSFDVEKTVVAA